MWRLQKVGSTTTLAFIPATSTYAAPNSLAAASVTATPYAVLGATASCPAGTVGDASTPTTCAPCDPGSFCDGSASTDCAAGEMRLFDCGGRCCTCPPCWRAHSAGVLTLPCPPSPHTDTYNPIYGAASNTACSSCATDFGPLAGSNAGSATCTNNAKHPDCSLSANGGGAGFYWDGDSASCVQCDVNTYLDSTVEAPTCSACPDGTVAAVGAYGATATAASACQPCNAGTYSGDDGTCPSCPEGMISVDNPAGNAGCTPW